MQQIIDHNKPDKTPAVFQLGFRIFFLSGALFSVIALFTWYLILFFKPELLNQSYFNNSHWWHAHEMIFGFSAAVIAGFLLTAVQNWTGMPGIKGHKLMGLFAVWLAARLLMLTPSPSVSPLIIPIIISIIDVLFLPLVALTLALPLIKIKQWKNLVFIPIILILTTENIMLHVGVQMRDYLLVQNSLWAAVLTITLLISVVGGRVIAFFTARKMAVEQLKPILGLDIVANGTVLLLVVYYAFSKPSDITHFQLGIVSAIAAAFQLIRMLRWKFWVTLSEPLLWSLHLSYLFIPIGFLLLSLNFFGYGIVPSQALHSFTVGAIGGVILAMISRVSLGHTGNQLRTLPGMKFAFVLMIVSAIFRSIIYSTELLSMTTTLTISFVYFIIAYAIFIWNYYSILTKPRTENRF